MNEILNVIKTNCCICNSDLIRKVDFDTDEYSAPIEDVNYFKYFLIKNNYLYYSRTETIHCKNCNYLFCLNRIDNGIYNLNNGLRDYTNIEYFNLHKLFDETKRSVTRFNIEGDSIQIHSCLYTSTSNKPDQMSISTTILFDSVDRNNFSIDNIRELLIFIDKYIYNYDLL